VPFAPGVEIVRNVVWPTLTHVGGAPDGPAVIIAPGGAYRFLAIEHEGFEVARRLSARGLSTYVLKYRTVPMPADEGGFRSALAEAFTPGNDWRAPVGSLVDDGPQAVRVVRGLGHSHVAMLGFSAGALLTTSTLWSDSPPDAAALIYPPTLDESLDAAPAVAPPLFMCMANDDPLTTGGVVRLHELWRAAGAPVDVHLFARGGHGFGTNLVHGPVDRWLELLGDWLCATSS
jgi:acetyl esterase/lipase